MLQPNFGHVEMKARMDVCGQIGIEARVSPMTLLLPREGLRLSQEILLILEDCLDVVVAGHLHLLIRRHVVVVVLLGGGNRLTVVELFAGVVLDAGEAGNECGAGEGERRRRGERIPVKARTLSRSNQFATQCVVQSA